MKHENMTELVLTTLRDGVEGGNSHERRKWSNDLKRIEWGPVWG